MGTESPDTERMHRLLGDALEDADLTWDVVPAVLSGYEHRVKVRRYQGAGAALAVLAIAGVAVSALPRGGTADRAAASRTTQGADYCRHEHWVSTPSPNVEVVNELARDPSADQANCEALTTAVRAVFPDARLVPAYRADLTLDSRLDQTLVKKVTTELRTDPLKGGADQMKYFGSELKYLAVHPDDPANVYLPDSYTAVTSAGREEFGIGLAVAKALPDQPDMFLGSTDSADCAKAPAALADKYKCTTVGRAGGWRGALWTNATDAKKSKTPTTSMSVMNRGQGTAIRFSVGGTDDEAWYVRGMYEGIQSDPHSVTWVNRWTGQTFAGPDLPASYALSNQQWAEFLNSPAFQKYADSYFSYIRNLAS